MKFLPIVDFLFGVIYNKCMKNTTNSFKKTFEISADGYKLKVYQVGASTKLNTTTQNKKKADTIKWIHSHFTYEVFFITSGELELITENYTKTYKKSILIVPPKFKHLSIPVNSESFCLLFSFEDKTEYINAVCKTLNEGVFELDLPNNIEFYIKAFSAAIENDNPAYTDAEHLSALIFSHIIRKLVDKPNNISSPQEANNKHINRIDAYINENIDKKLCLTDVSSAVYLSTKQISRIIRKEYGCTFCELLCDKRLARAEILLKNTDIKISEIAQQTFCHTPTYFYTAFKAKYGMTPLKYRKEISIQKTVRNDS